MTARHTPALLATILLVANAAGAADKPPLQDRISRRIGHFQGTMGIAVKNLDTGQSFAVNGDVRFPTASLIKVAVMVEVLPPDRRG